MHTYVEKINGFTHPCIDDIYLKRSDENVLVIEASRGKAGSSSDAADQLIADLLIDLPTIQNNVEHAAGAFDRVDIRLH